MELTSCRSGSCSEGGQHVERGVQLTLLCSWGQMGAPGKELEALLVGGSGREAGPVSDFQTSDLWCVTWSHVISPCQACNPLSLVL